MPMIFISRDQTRHLTENGKLYDPVFRKVLNFHDGVAAAEDASGAYHIDMKGREIYSRRFTRTYGFYEGAAAAGDSSGAFHIGLDGEDLYPQRYEWVGNFQEGRCPVRLKTGEYSYIDIGGKLSPSRYAYAGDFSGGIAAVWVSGEGAMHIRRDGSPLNGKRYLGAGGYSDGMAPVRDRGGWYLADEEGKDAGNGARYDFLEIPRRNEAIASRNGEFIISSQGTERSWPIPKSETEPEPPLPAWLKELSAADFDSCAVFMRHSRRLPRMRSDPESGILLPLSPSGKRLAERIGEELARIRREPAKVFSSPVERCVRTAETISSAAGWGAPVEQTDVIGLPGTAFICDSSRSGEMGGRSLQAFTADHMCGEQEPGWYDVRDGVRNLLDFVFGNFDKKGDLALYVSHDAFLVRLVGLVAGSLCGDRWVGFCDGCLLYSRGGERFLMWKGREFPISDLEYCRREALGIGAAPRLSDASAQDTISWKGDECEGLTAACDRSGHYSYVLPTGEQAFDCGGMVYGREFKYETAAVMYEGKGFTHITDCGERLHDRWFEICCNYHKGYAAVRDPSGWFHIDADGNDLYPERYLYAEPFYNDRALCVDGNGMLITRGTDGKITALMDLKAVE